MSVPRDLEKAALRGEPSYVWREGQQRRLKMIVEAAENRIEKSVLVDGCGIGMYLHHLGRFTQDILGLDIEFDRLQEAKKTAPKVINGAGEALPFQNDSFDLILSHEVLEHVQDDQAAINEIVRTLKPGGRLILFCPNRGYPFETHGHYWRGKYHFGNTPLINYLPRSLRDKLAPHVNIYTRGDLMKLFEGLPIKFINRRTIFGAYDNIIARHPHFGKQLRKILQWMEQTPFQVFGLSHFWVVEKIA